MRVYMMRHIAAGKPLAPIAVLLQCMHDRRQPVGLSQAVQPAPNVPVRSCTLHSRPTHPVAARKLSADGGDRELIDTADDWVSKYCGGPTAWRMARGAWHVAHDTWCMTHGAWCIVHGTRHTAHGAWRVARGT